MENFFALDIGTRVVIGLVMQKSQMGYEILASARAEHTYRAMYDGQVHDVNEVSRVVLNVKKELEQKLGIQLNKVAVAAAGRALCTETAKVSREEAFPIHWESQEVLSLEMEAVQQAMQKIRASEMSDSYFYCVGYNTIKCKLEDQFITSLIGQRGKRAELTVIATFLPRTVVDSLMAVLERAGLELANLTLEPIAAGIAAIPVDMRKLNLALVDIGAGTADIALTTEGSFFSYGMVPLAGDEVTEPICSHYLLDFHEGEKVKRGLLVKEEIELVNFFGEKTIISKSDVLDIIKPTVKNMAERIGQEILLLNENKQPQAVILVGGGSLTPLLGDFLAQFIALPRTRVGVQVRERLNAVKGDENKLIGPDVITPIGIGMAALDGKGLHYYSVSVNDVIIPLFDLQLATVAEALLSAGIQPRSFLGRPGTALIYFLDGDMRVIKGGLGTPAQITVNGQPARFEQRLYPNDCVTFIPGYAGANAKAKIKDVITLSPSKKIIWNGFEEEFSPVVYIDNKIAGIEDWLEDGCKIVIKDNKTLFDYLKFKEIDFSKLKEKEITVDGKSQEIISGLEIRINGVRLFEDCFLHNNDIVEVIEKEIYIKDLRLEPEPMSFVVNGENFLFPPQGCKIFFKGNELSSDNLVEDGMELRVESLFQKPILSELFPYLNLMENVIPGSRLEMKVNGKEAEFTTVLNQGDRITINWSN